MKLSSSKVIFLPVLLQLVTLTSSCGGSSTDVDSMSALREQRSSAIVNGTAHPYPGVGTLIHIEDGLAIAGCTATVIGPRSVLTAAHCVTPIKPGAVVRFGYWESSGVPVLSDLNPSVSFIANPGYIDRDATDAPTGTFIISGNKTTAKTTHADLAVITFAKRFTDAPPFQLIDTTLTAKEPVTIFGVGLTAGDATADFSLRSTNNQVEGTTLDQVYYVGASNSEGNICHGDSGGPTIVAVDGGTPTLVGVHSEGTCKVVTGSLWWKKDVSLGIDTQITPYLSWLNEKIASAPPGDPTPIITVGAKNTTIGTQDFVISSLLGVKTVKVTVDDLVQIDNNYEWKEWPTNFQATFPTDKKAHKISIEVQDLNGGITQSTVNISNVAPIVRPTPSGPAPDANDSPTPNSSSGCQAAGTLPALWILAAMFVLFQRRTSKQNNI